MDRLKSIGAVAASSVTSSFLEKPLFDVVHNNEVSLVGAESC